MRWRWGEGSHGGLCFGHGDDLLVGGLDLFLPSLTFQRLLCCLLPAPPFDQEFSDKVVLFISMRGHFLVVTGTRLWVLAVFSGQGPGQVCSAYFTVKICSLQCASSILVEKCCFRPSSHLPSPPLGPGFLNLQSCVGSRGPISCLIFFPQNVCVCVGGGVCVKIFIKFSKVSLS